MRVSEVPSFHLAERMASSIGGGGGRGETVHGAFAAVCAAMGDAPALVTGSPDGVPSPPLVPVSFARLLKVCAAFASHLEGAGGRSEAEGARAGPLGTSPPRPALEGLLASLVASANLMHIVVSPAHAGLNLRRRVAAGRTADNGRGRGRRRWRVVPGGARDGDRTEDAVRRRRRRDVEKVDVHEQLGRRVPGHTHGRLDGGAQGGAGKRGGLRAE